MKDKIKQLLLKHAGIYQISAYIYTIFLHKERLMKRVSFGNENPNNTVFIIRPNAEDGIQGLLSLAAETLRWIDYADKNEYIPVVDYKNFNTQYGNGVDNVWDYYFNQPSSMSLKSAYQSKNVIYSGITKKPVLDIRLFSGEMFRNREVLQESKRIAQSWLILTEEVKQIVEKENSVVHAEDCIGVYIRGTDYTRLKPIGEYVQPSIEQIIDKIREFSIRYGEKPIFLVTEDDFYYQALVGMFGNRIKIVSYDSFIKNYKEDVFLSKSDCLDENKKDRGMKYLVKIILLSKCRYLVSSIAKGSIMAYSLNKNGYEDEFVFDFGVYK